MSLSPRDLMPLARYRQLRPQVCRAMAAYRRQLARDLGPCMRVQFEDRRTVWFQVQEAACAEGIDDDTALWQLIETYAHLLPEPGQLKATVSVTPVEGGAASVGAASLLGPAIGRIALQPAPGHGWTGAAVNEDADDGWRSRPCGVHVLRFCIGPLRYGDAATIACLDPGYAHRATVVLPAMPASPPAVVVPFSGRPA